MKRYTLGVKLPILFGLAALSATGQIALNRTPSRVAGHSQVPIVTVAPNLPESRDLNGPSGIAIDGSVSPPILYVSDTGNNRVLAWRDATGFQNGAPADLVIGQRDFNTTLEAGPGTTLSTGLRSPTGLAVDGQGNVYVADSGNNRILRYPRPFQQADAFKLPNMVIGQANTNQNIPNNTNTPTAAVNARGLALSFGQGRTFRTSMVFDANGNLWVSDSGNNRVLRYPLAALQSGANYPAADQAVGQTSLTTVTAQVSSDPRNKNALVSPNGLAFDNQGRLYVTDGLGRVSVFTRPVTGAGADRIMGVFIGVQGQPARPDVNEQTLGRVDSGRLSPPEGVFFAAGTPYVLDSPSNRIVRFDPYESWAPESTSFSPPGRNAFGQVDLTSFRPNRGLSEPSNVGFSNPIAAAVFNNELFVSDAGNNRVMVFTLQAGNLGTATRVLGQGEFAQSAPNYIDGREMFMFGGFTQVGSAQANDGGGVVVDSRSNPPRLYIADSFNHRILGFRDARTVRAGDRADIVIGQSDFGRSLINNPANDANQLTENGLFVPVGLAVDGGGNLYVADSANGRVLRYPDPFAQAAQIRPDLVLGQSSFFQKITDATARTMGRPFGLAFTQSGDLLVSDAAHNRILYFRKPEGGDFSNGQPAEKVIGQSDFSTIAAGVSNNRLFSPRGISTDSDDRLYVADVGNNRLVIYDSVAAAENDPFPALTIPGLSSPHSVFVSQRTGEIWVTNTGTDRVVRLPRYIDMLLTGVITANYDVLSFRPFAIAQDDSGALFVADAANRIAIYFPGVAVSNDGHKLPLVSPGAIVSLRAAVGTTFGSSSLRYTEVGTDAPTVLGDLSVRIGGTRAPVLSVSAEEVRAIVPQGTPTGATEFLITRDSTGQILGATEFSVSRIAPALLTVSADGNGQVIAKNPDGTDNDAINRTGRSQTLSLFATGFGVTPGAPPDGVAPAEKVRFSGQQLRVLLATDFVPDANIEYAGLAPGMVGVIQIDVKVPDRVPPEQNVPVILVLGSTPSNIVNGIRRTTTVAIKP
jgi:uncharacterized protein (TIGR03437 family)